MDYDLNIEQKLLKDSAREFLSKECDSTYIREMAEDERGFRESVWKKIAELGWLGILIPEEYGGLDMSFLDMAILLYETGYAAFPGPFFSTAVLGVITVLEAGNETQKARLLRGVAEGSWFLTLAWPEMSGRYSPQEVMTEGKIVNDGCIVTGVKCFVPDADVANTILCVVRTGTFEEDRGKGISLVAIDRMSPGLRLEKLHTLSLNKLYRVTLDGVKVTSDNILGNVHEGWEVLKRVLTKGAVAKCAEMCGGGQKVLEMTVDYAKQRVQFDRPIGTFQAVQHHCANMVTYLDTSTLITYEASWKISEKMSFEKSAWMCKAWVSDYYRKLVALAHQVMGGLGYMEETDLQFFFRHAKTAELFLGDASYHRELVAQAMGLS